MAHLRNERPDPEIAARTARGIASGIA